MATYDLGQVVGSQGKGITSITKTGSSGKVDTYTITYSDNTTSTFTVTNGSDGAKGDTGNTGATGKGITSISKTGSSGLVDTYTITYSDSTTSTFTVTNGSDASISAGTGLSKSSDTINHSNSVSALTTSSLKKIKHDSTGHITETANASSTDLSDVSTVQVLITYTDSSTETVTFLKKVS